MPKAICIRKCQLNGIVERGEERMLSDEQLKLPVVKSSFRVIGPAEQAKAEAAKADDKKPLTGADGAPLAPNAQMTNDALKAKLTDLKVRFPETASRQELFSLLQQALEPHTGDK